MANRPARPPRGVSDSVVAGSIDAPPSVRQARETTENDRSGTQRDTAEDGKARRSALTPDLSYGILVLSTRRHPAPQAPEQPHIAPHHTHPRPSTSRHRALDAQNHAGIGRNRAAGLAVFAAIVPLLPPITPNVKLPRPAIWLEFSVREETAPDISSKSGKNGNVHLRSQHCRRRVRVGGRRGQRPSRRGFNRRPAARLYSSNTIMPGGQRAPTR